MNRILNSKFWTFPCSCGLDWEQVWFMISLFPSNNSPNSNSPEVQNMLEISDFCSKLSGHICCLTKGHNTYSMWQLESNKNIAIFDIGPLFVFVVIHDFEKLTVKIVTTCALPTDKCKTSCKVLWLGWYEQMNMLMYLYYALMCVMIWS